MTTIAQLPPAASVGARDLLPLSQAGSLYSVTISQLTANLQPLISIPTGELLGRHSVGAGGAEAIAVGVGVAISSGALLATGGDHAGFPLQAAMSLTDDIVINTNGTPGLLPITALRGLFSAGTGLSVDANGVWSVTVSAIAGPAGPPGPAGPTGPMGATGPSGPTGAGLAGPAAGNTASSIGASDYVALWQNGAISWMPYGQFLGGQTIDEIPSAAPATDSDQLLVAQGTNALSVQSFGAIWSYVQNKLPSVQEGVVELIGNTVLDSTQHNNRILVASSTITISANFANMGPGFHCTLINLAPGSVTMGTGITSGSGSTTLPPGAATTLVGISYSGGSLIWWSGVVPNAPTITVGSIAAPSLNTSFTVSGGLFNDAPTALDYSTNGGISWIAAPSPVITANAYSFTVAGLGAGTYTVRVRDHSNAAVLGVSNSFTIAAPTITLASIPSTIQLNIPVALAGTVSPTSNAVQVGLSSSASTAPNIWVNATVNNGNWTASLTPSTVGTVYVWAEQQVSPAVNVVSSAITVVAAALSITAPATGTAGTAISITGTVTPSGDAVNVQLANQNTSAPTSGWSAATVSGGGFSAVLTPSAGGNYYAWAQDTATGLTSVSQVIAISAAPALTYGINNPGGSYVHAVSVIGINGGISPPQNIATQIALSTSNTVVPTSGWQASSIIYANALWANYYPTPANAGSYYVWVQTATGASTTVSTFTIPVT